MHSEQANKCENLVFKLFIFCLCSNSKHGVVNISLADLPQHYNNSTIFNSIGGGFNLEV